MALIPVNHKGYHKVIDLDAADAAEGELFEHNNKIYQVTYETMCPIEKELVVVKPDIAKAAIKEFIETEVGGYIDGEFKKIKKLIDDKFETNEKQLRKHISNKSDKLAEVIATELTSSNFKQSVEDKIKEKIGKLTNDLLKDD